MSRRPQLQVPPTACCRDRLVCSMKWDHIEATVAHPDACAHEHFHDVFITHPGDPRIDGFHRAAQIAVLDVGCGIVGIRTDLLGNMRRLCRQKRGRAEQR